MEVGLSLGRQCRIVVDKVGGTWRAMFKAGVMLHGDRKTKFRMISNLYVARHVPS